ncbi:discoidin domain-containing protein [Saccharothrix sp.]|uniref:galactose-binding domain-containing protein n=1 Tax=Saccharothrix sp. TaxID=1873460 RepID=UPI0028113E60|nr:discoidin domain-containing protein [Saccharothrix sp.]
MTSLRPLLAAAVALLLGIALASTPTAPAQAAGGPATDWMTGRFGVMMHYLAEGCPAGCNLSDYPNSMPTVEQWNARVDNFDVAGVVQQVKSVGASWFQLSVGQNTGYFSAPNATYEALVPPTQSHPSRLSRRDLVKELGAALHQAGIKFIVYLTSDAVQRDDYARQQLGGPSQGWGAPNTTYQANWLNVVNTWSQQWGTDVDGYWVDGAYYSQLEPFYDQMAVKLRSGNPNALLSFNAGFNVPLTSLTTQSDFTPGETGVNNWPRPTNGRWVDNRGTQMQLQYLGVAQSDWGYPPDTPMSYSADRLVELTTGALRVGGAVTWDVGYKRENGHISDPAMAQFKQLGLALKAFDGNLSRGRATTQSSTYAGGGDASLAVDGNTTANYFSGSVTHTSETPLDTDPWWQVDLGASKTVGSVKLWNRTDCCADRLRNFYVFASDSPFTSNDPNVLKTQSGVWSSYRAEAVGQTLTLPVNRTARYVRVQLVGSDRPLSLAEVEVFGDLALHKPVAQSSKHPSGAGPERANDGNTNGSFFSGSVTHTSETPLDANPWWQVDLGASKTVGSVKLWNRTDCCADRLRNFYVFASDSPFTSNDPNVLKTQSGVWSSYRAEAVGQTLTLPVNRTARYVRVQLVGSDRPLSLAEVQILG